MLMQKQFLTSVLSNAAVQRVLGVMQVNFLSELFGCSRRKESVVQSDERMPRVGFEIKTS